MKFNLSQFDMSTITKKIVILLLLLLLVRVPLAQYPIYFTSPKAPAFFHLSMMSSLVPLSHNDKGASKDLQVHDVMKLKKTWMRAGGAMYPCNLKKMPQRNAY